MKISKPKHCHTLTTCSIMKCDHQHPNHSWLSKQEKIKMWLLYCDHHIMVTMISDYQKGEIKIPRPKHWPGHNWLSHFHWWPGLSPNSVWNLLHTSFLPFYISKGLASHRNSTTNFHFSWQGFCHIQYFYFAKSLPRTVKVGFRVAIASQPF